MIKIRTQETNQKYETWEYEIHAPLPEGFMDWNGEDQYSWLIKNTYDAILVDSEYANLGTIDSYDILD